MRWRACWKQWFHQPQHERIRAMDAQIKKLSGNLEKPVLGYALEGITFLAWIVICVVFQVLHIKNLVSLVAGICCISLLLGLGISLEIPGLIEIGNRNKKNLYSLCGYFPMERKALFQVRVGYILKKMRNRGILFLIFCGIFMLLRRQWDGILFFFTLCIWIVTAGYLIWAVRIPKRT